MSRSDGFTLIELMLVVSILGVLSSIALPNINRTIRASQEARTKGNLGTIRQSITNYTIQAGFPPQRLEDILTGPDALLTVMPLKYTPPYHPEGNSVTNGSMAAMADSRGDWFYANDSTESEYGSVFVNCSHTALNGKVWLSQ